MQIVVHIERLVLDGLPITGRDAAVLGEAVRQELAQLLAAGGIAPALQAGGAVASVPVQSVGRPYGSPVDTGARVASAAYRGFGATEGGDR
jgi:hypothetical protein